MSQNNFISVLFYTLTYVKRNRNKITETSQKLFSDCFGFFLHVNKCANAKTVSDYFSQSQTEAKKYRYWYSVMKYNEPVFYGLIQFRCQKSGRLTHQRTAPQWYIFYRYMYTVVTLGALWVYPYRLYSL